MPVRVDWWYVEDALAPDGKGHQGIYVPEAFVYHLFENGPERKYFDVDAVPDVLRQPTSIHQGLNREEFEESYCYIGKPKTRWNGHFDEKPPPGKIFAVYVIFRGDKDDLAVFDWEWIEEDPNNLGFPPDCDQRYTRQTWPPKT